MDIQTIVFYAIGFFLALFILKFIIKIPFLLIRFGLLAAIAYGIYLFVSKGM